MIKVKDLFYLKYGVNLEYNKMSSLKNGIPFVGRGKGNNGVVDFVRRVDNIKPNPAYTISVACSGSVLESFFQNKEYYSGRDVYYLRPKKRLSKEQMLYYCTILQHNKYRYSYGRQANKTLEEILIPSIEEIPAWFHTIALPEPTKEPYHPTQVSLKDRKWGWFRYKALFGISRGKRLIKENRTKGETPYFSAIEKNNGLTDYISNPLFVKQDSLIYTTFGDAYYIKDKFTASDEISILENNKLNSFTGLFLATIIQQNKYRYSFGRKAFRNKFIKDGIQLPINKEGKPDWHFMEYYIKSLPYSKNLDYKKDLNTKNK